MLYSPVRASASGDGAIFGWLPDRERSDVGMVASVAVASISTVLVYRTGDDGRRFRTRSHPLDTTSAKSVFPRCEFFVNVAAMKKPPPAITGGVFFIGTRL